MTGNLKVVEELMEQKFLVGSVSQFVEVVQIIPPDVLRVIPQEQTFERVVEILVSQIGKEIGDVMQITPPEVLKVRPRERIFKRMLKPSFVADCRKFCGTHSCVESGTAV